MAATATVVKNGRAGAADLTANDVERPHFSFCMKRGREKELKRKGAPEKEPRVSIGDLKCSSRMSMALYS